jgi:hypothetical protein
LKDSVISVYSTREGEDSPSRVDKDGKEWSMSILPDRAMVDVASRVIDLLGDAMSFQRCIDGTWEESVPSTTVYLQPRDSLYRRSFRGMEGSLDFKAFATADSGIRKGDRTIINSTYYIIDTLEDRGTHVEFGLRQTDEIQDE